MENTSSAHAGELAHLPSGSPDLDVVNPDLIKVLRAEEILAQTPSLGGDDAEHLRQDSTPLAVPAKSPAAENTH